MASKVKRKNEAFSCNAKLCNIVWIRFSNKVVYLFLVEKDIVTMDFKTLQCSGRLSVKCLKALIVENFCHQMLHGTLKSEAFKAHYNDQCSMECNFQMRAMSQCGTGKGAASVKLEN